MNYKNNRWFDGMVFEEQLHGYGVSWENNKWTYGYYEYNVCKKIFLKGTGSAEYIVSNYFYKIN